MKPQRLIESPLLETSITGARGVLMNITGGSDLNLFEVQEAASIVSSTSDDELNMIFGSVINENLKDHILVTVIATGFKEQESPLSKPSPSAKERIPASRLEVQHAHSHRGESDTAPQNDRKQSQPSIKSLDIPAFFHNRRNR